MSLACRSLQKKLQIPAKPVVTGVSDSVQAESSHSWDFRLISALRRAPSGGLRPTALSPKLHRPGAEIRSGAAFRTR